MPRNKQTVHFGVTQTGQHGLFTNNTIAYPLSQEQLEIWHQLTLEQQRLYCSHLGFELESNRS